MASAAPKIPSAGEPITLREGRLQVPDRPIVPFIEGDGTGSDIWRASSSVQAVAAEKAEVQKESTQRGHPEAESIQARECHVASANH